MTLCIAWIRQDGDKKELVMATDSRLTGGESWDSGVKLFELPRQDCLLCFAGSTARAYPLILNTISSLKFDKGLASPHTDIHDVLEYLIELFSKLVAEIKDAVGNPDEVRAEAQFLFGGWSWKRQQFGIWRLYYNPGLKAFAHEAIDQGQARVITYLGDHIPEAEDLLENKMRETGSLRYGTLNMEPLQILAQMARDPREYRPIGGAIQIAKIYQSGTSEFFGILWPSANGRPTFLGRALPVYDLPPVRLFDPDTARIIEDILPDTLSQIDTDLYGPEYEFVAECYPDSALKADLSDQKRKRLQRVIQSAAYRKYCAEQNQVVEAVHD